MNKSHLTSSFFENRLSLKFSGEFTLYEISKYKTQIDNLDLSQIKNLELDLENLLYIDTAASIYINNFQKEFVIRGIEISIVSSNKDIQDTIKLVSKQDKNLRSTQSVAQSSFVQKLGKYVYDNYKGFLLFIAFIGELFTNKFYYVKSVKNIRFKEIAYEINENAIKAFWIIALTSFLIGLVVAYQSAYQLKLYGANIFIVDMIGISMLRELAPLITAIVIAGRSGSAFTAQIGAMKITQELDAMRTMGFDPYAFLVVPRILALMISMPILIFVADIMGTLGGILVASLDLGITIELFLDRFSEVVDVKHFYIGIIKGPFFAFLIATIGIYRGLVVKDDTQSIGFNTTKSVVESIFAVIICDALFSIAFTNLGI